MWRRTRRPPRARRSWRIGGTFPRAGATATLRSRQASPGPDASDTLHAWYSCTSAPKCNYEPKRDEADSREHGRRPMLAPVELLVATEQPEPHSPSAWRTMMLANSLAGTTLRHSPVRLHETQHLTSRPEPLALTLDCAQSEIACNLRLPSSAISGGYGYPPRAPFDRLRVLAPAGKLA